MSPNLKAVTVAYPNSDGLSSTANFKYSCISERLSWCRKINGRDEAYAAYSNNFIASYFFYVTV